MSDEDVPVRVRLRAPSKYLVLDTFVLGIFSFITSNFFEKVGMYQNLDSYHFEDKNSGEYDKELSCLHVIHPIYTIFIASTYSLWIIIIDK